MVKKTTKKDEYFEGVGRRKNAVARVRVFPGATKTKVGITVNEKPIDSYFPSAEMQEIINSPLKKTKNLKDFFISVKVRGGGAKGQAEAVRLGISRALLKIDSRLRPALKEEGFLTRDSRAKERRKFGLKKARKAAQWSKR